MLILFVSVVLGSMTIIGPLLMVLAWIAFRGEKPAKLQALLLASLGVVLFATGVVSFVVY